MSIPNTCKLCPRSCGANRAAGQAGRCGGGDAVRVARAALHFWEEPCISGTRGSGTVFFSGCPLHCCFCQNHPVSAGNFGKQIATERLSDIFLELQAQGAHNINLVNPTHWIPWIVQALAMARPRLRLPVVYNSGGYERVETLRTLEGLVDVFLPDLKFYDTALSARYAGAPDYFSYAAPAVTEMHRQAGAPRLDKDGVLCRGVIVRHLALPKAGQDSRRILDWMAATFGKGEVWLSLMSQYTPSYHSEKFPEINRRISSFEYKELLAHAQTLGLEGYMQERSAAREEYTPPFDLTGV